MTVIAGSFQSQDGNFSVHSNCTWIIQVPATDIRIELYIFYFVYDAVSYGECSSGRVKVSLFAYLYSQTCLKRPHKTRYLYPGYTKYIGVI